MQEYVGLARRIAQRYLPYCGGAADLDDLMQAAAIGAMLAEETYTPAKGTWPSWCAYYIRNEMRAALGIRTAKRDPAGGTQRYAGSGGCAASGPPPCD